MRKASIAIAILFGALGACATTPDDVSTETRVSGDASAGSIESTIDGNTMRVAWSGARAQLSCTRAASGAPDGAACDEGYAANLRSGEDLAWFRGAADSGAESIAGCHVTLDHCVDHGAECTFTNCTLQRAMDACHSLNVQYCQPWGY